MSTDSTPSSAASTYPARRRWGRFSLRTLLIAVTLASLAMALFTFVKDRCHRPHRAVAAIKANGGRVSFVESEQNPGPIEAWLRTRLPRTYFDEVKAIRFEKAEEELLGTDDGFFITFAAHARNMQALKIDHTLVHLSGLTSLQRLHLDQTHVSDAGLVHLSNLRSLQELHLSHTEVSDDGLVHLSALASLEWLDLSGTRVSDAGLVHLSNLTSLRMLKLCHTRVSSDGVEELKCSLPKCSIDAEYWSRW